MNVLEILAGLDWWFVAGWTMLHYLWLGLAVGVTAGASRLVLRRASAQVRYGVAVVWLVVLALLPAGIAVWVGSRPQSVKDERNPGDRAMPSEIASSAPGSVGGRVDLRLGRSDGNRVGN